MSTTDATRIELAFINVAMSQPALHGQWIPVNYWAFLVSNELEGETIKASKLKRALIGAVERDLDHTTEDQSKYCGISQLRCTEHRVRQRKVSIPITASGTRKQAFYCVETKHSTAHDLPQNKDLVASYFRRQYSKFASYITEYYEPQEDQKDGDSAAANRASLDPTTFERRAGTDSTAVAPPNGNSSGARPVTPPNVSTDCFEDKSDKYSVKRVLEELFMDIINPELLAKGDFFSTEYSRSSEAFLTLKKRVQKLGCVFHKNEVRQHYDRFYVSNTTLDSTRKSALDSSSLQESQHLVLTQRFNIPLSLPALHDIVRGILNVAITVPDVLELPKMGGNKASGGRLLAVTASTTENRLYANAKQWMPKLLQAAVEDDAAMSKYHVVSTLIRVLASIDEQAFVDVSQSSKAKEALAKIDPSIQKALMYDAHLSQHQFKLIRKYSIVAIGYNMWQPEKRIKALDVDIFAPTHVPFKDGHRKRMAHYRPVDEIFKWKLDIVLGRTGVNSSSSSSHHSHQFNNIEDIAECHIVVGGDHGQGAFRFIANLLLFSKGSDTHKYRVEFEEDFLCGFIECKKDTYEALASTIALPLNESLKTISQGEELVFLKQSNSKFIVEWGAAKAAVHVQNGAAIIRAVPVQLFLVGDLAFQLLAQGREGMASYWCARCQWGWGHWQSIPDNVAACSRTGAAWSWDLKKGMHC
jgi:hypothetical protein